MIVFEDDKARYRFLGVVVWFFLLMLFVPSWYANPVNFVPHQVQLDSGYGEADKRVLFPQAYRLPSKDNSEEVMSQAKKDAEQIAIEDLALKKQSALSDAQTPAQNLSNSQQATELKVNRSQFEKSAEQAVAEKQEAIKKASVGAEGKVEALPPVNDAGDWLLLLASYPNKKEAQNFMRSVEQAGYSTAMKFYSKQQIYSVRVIGIESRAKAQIVKKKLDKMFNLNDSIIRQNR
ncbi:SPOR domain-containing protein [Thiomicrorhabdus indica]|uniref:SPOR domain-containing protein n=1 Tax=Thiomicrorhabdus indica TaxID=2267253 RepID=UPI00102D75A7|nr:SPOR domain-containing protein [Thiomicrorhabdus indica]